jgi:hypothetical protein
MRQIVFTCVQQFHRSTNGFGNSNGFGNESSTATTSEAAAHI